MSDRIPKNEYEVSYLHLIFFILLIVLLLLIAFFIGYKTGEKRVCKKEVAIVEKVNNKKAQKPQKKNSSLEKNKKKDVVKEKIKKQIVEKTEQKVKNVEQEVKKTKEKTIPQKETITYKKGYYVQIAATQDLATAKKNAKKYRKYFKVIIFYPKESDDVKWYKLRTGPFKTRQQAKNYLLKLKNRYKIKGFITKVE